MVINCQDSRFSNSLKEEINMKTISTFSIVGYDPEKQEWGVAVQSKFLAAGAAVPFARAGAGAIATQANANLDYGELGLVLLQKGYSAKQVVDALVTMDEGREQRQVGVVDSQGNSYTYTGKECSDWAGGICGPNFSCQGNILVNKETVEAMAESFQHSEGSLAHRLIEALDAAQQAGGDSRGRQAAALLVVKEHGSYGGFNDRMIDLRVDDEPDPIGKLAHLLELHELYFGTTEVKVPMEGDICRQVQEALKEKGHYSGEITGVYDEATKYAFSKWCGIENYEERICEGEFMDEVVLNILLGK